MKLFITWLISAVAIFISAWLIPGVSVSGFWTVLLVALVLGVVNAVVRPILLILTLPINILTLGLFTLVINALMVLLVSAIIPGFIISGFWIALIFSLILSAIVWILEGLSQEQDK
ncbi:MAG TPA: phage holin family protein [Patescibacteria group bacterium]|nr:phage holin family protein [Patescibacteria group bacterium]